LDYAPVVDVRKAYSKVRPDGGQGLPIDGIVEASKYCTKATDLLALGPVLADFHQQLRSLRLIGISGDLQRYISADEPAGTELNDVQPEDPLSPLAVKCRAFWDESEGHYRIDS
jgi:hypothetical protein